jgi:choline kinase
MSRGIILAAGRGSRLQSLTEDRPKCLVELRGKPLLQWQIDAMRAAGLSRLAAVRGYRGDMLEGFGLTLFDNERWRETNMVRSLTLAGEWLEREPCIVSYSDIFYPPDAVAALLEATSDIAITYDPNWLELWSARFDDPLRDAETFRVDARSILTDIGRRPGSLAEVQGQYMGLLRFTPAGWRTASGYLDGLSGEAVDRLDVTSLLRALIGNGVAIQAIATPVVWGEIDHESDLRLYSSRP